MDTFIVLKINVGVDYLQWEIIYENKGMESWSYLKMGVNLNLNNQHSLHLADHQQST